VRPDVEAPAAARELVGAQAELPVLKLGIASRTSRANGPGGRSAVAGAAGGAGSGWAVAGGVPAGCTGADCVVGGALPDCPPPACAAAGARAAASIVNTRKASRRQ